MIVPGNGKADALINVYQSYWHEMVRNVYFSENDLNPSLFQNSNLVLTTGQQQEYVTQRDGGTK